MWGVRVYLNGGNGLGAFSHGLLPYPMDKAFRILFPSHKRSLVSIQDFDTSDDIKVRANM